MFTIETFNLGSPLGEKSGLGGTDRPAAPCHIGILAMWPAVHQNVRHQTMVVTASTQEWLEWVLVTSIPLRRLNLPDVPIEFASACLVDYRGRRFLLSVQHAVDMGSKDWIVDLGYESGKGTAFYRPYSFNYVIRGSGSIRGIDFCYTEVPSDLISTYQHMTPRGILDERVRDVFRWI
jgi:hypothetical protein